MSFPTTISLSEEQVIETSDTQVLPLGTRGMASDGRMFRYAQAGGADIKANRLCISADESKGGQASATDQRLYDNYAIGTTMVQIYLSTMTTAGDSWPVNYFKDGYMMVNSTDVAAYQMCQIDSSEVLTSSTAVLGTAASHNTIWLKPPGLKKVGDTDTGNVKLVTNPYKYVVISTIANGPGYPVGVTPCAVTTLYYFWLQTWGPTIAVAGEGARPSIDQQPGMELFWSTAIAGTLGGAIGTATAAGNANIDTDSGWARHVGPVGNLMTAAPAANNYCMINLKLAP